MGDQYPNEHQQGGPAQVLLLPTTVSLLNHFVNVPMFVRGRRSRVQVCQWVEAAPQDEQRRARERRGVRAGFRAVLGAGIVVGACWRCPGWSWHLVRPAGGYGAGEFGLPLVVALSLGAVNFVDQDRAGQLVEPWVVSSRRQWPGCDRAP